MFLVKIFIIIAILRYLLLYNAKISFFKGIIKFYNDNNHGYRVSL